MKLTQKQAWALAQEYGKAPPYRGYALDLGGGLVLTHTKSGKYIVLDFPITPEKVQAFEKENKEFIDSLPQLDSTPLIARIRHSFFEGS